MTTPIHPSIHPRSPGDYACRRVTTIRGTVECGATEDVPLCVCATCRVRESDVSHAPYVPTSGKTPMAPSIHSFTRSTRPRTTDGRGQRPRGRTEEWVRYSPFIIRQSTSRFCLIFVCVCVVCVDEGAPAFFFLESGLGLKVSWTRARRDSIRFDRSKPVLFGGRSFVTS